MPLTQEAELRTEPSSSSPAKGEALLHVQDLRISFVTRAGVIQAINDVSFEVKRAESFGLVGETGCGKSQTAFALMRLTPDAGIIERGEIWFDKTNLTSNIDREFKIIRKENGQVKLRRNKSELKRLNVRMSKIRGKDISMIFQEPMTSLDPVYTIGRQISEVLLTHGTGYLADRILARNSVSREQLMTIAKFVTATNYQKKSPSERQDVQKELHRLLEQFGLEGLEDQVIFIMNRKDIGTSQKVESILALGEKKIGPSTVSFLLRLRSAQGKMAIGDRLVNKLPIINKSQYGVLRKEALAVSYELLSLVNMPNADSVLNQYPHELSGGMRQRVMIAMAIAAKPKLVIADEPTSALDVTVQAQILDLLRDLKTSLNTAVLFISHDMGVISEICDRVGVMYAGNIVEIAKMEDLFASPKHPYTQGLLAAIPKYGGKSETLQTIKGSVPDLINPPKGCRFTARCPYVFEKCMEGPPWIEVGKDHYVLCWLYGDSEKHVHQ